VRAVARRLHRRRFQKTNRFQKSNRRTEMKTFLLTAAVAAGLFCSTSTAHAQFSRGGGVFVFLPLNTGSYSPPYYSYPTYSYYVYPTYTYEPTTTYTYQYFTYPPSTYVSPGEASSPGASEFAASHPAGGVYTHPTGWSTYTYPTSARTYPITQPPSYIPYTSTAPSGAYRLAGGVWHW
jgi:hypothetical protein